ncbi:hypothetical protein D1R32_gp256 [Tunisvirus fontaine2]|uniref:Uncharacterized protein n=1 Tax=Tunisvirus fontaine2 TaxID=1421067 RepID=V9SDK1_9VIRU|nr:hypothetical protein D1R32_gp256 [Tunisvirus fontaine2]AHC54973.1 hypothetical protein TNS_ORF255 [Tunisvirus fontaine2]
MEPERIDIMNCPFCGNRVVYQDFVEHLKVHKNEGLEDAIFSCGPCEYTCNNIYNAMSHCSDVDHIARCAYAKTKAMGGDDDFCSMVVRAHYRAYGDHDNSFAIVGEMRNFYSEKEPEKHQKKRVPRKGKQTITKVTVTL